MIIKKLKELGYEYSPATLQVLDFPFNAAVKVGNLVFTSGQVSMHGDTIIKGKVGADISLEEARKGAEICAYNCLRAVGAVTDINNIVRVVKVLGMVNNADGFNDTSGVINGASQLFVDVFGDRGMSTRSAVGMQIPADWAVEVEAIFEVK